ncbi:hypothetical protein BO71DRAFT_223087 [Aspergillus ellipticus CBS 707.79]|uniref:Uncharacterized protein n=1 Tax=Aspergillus ellipticus CBS 707.79 TaxID=1448320 RepID=A0A319DP69_9EURO|nr:hypothetical protein BO71DRAFT_223087 [Aspergillus ellipticus CBS 707.79]
MSDWTRIAAHQEDDQRTGRTGNVNPHPISCARQCNTSIPLPVPVHYSLPLPWASSPSASSVIILPSHPVHPHPGSSSNGIGVQGSSALDAPPLLPIARFVCIVLPCFCPLIPPRMQRSCSATKFDPENSRRSRQKSPQPSPISPPMHLPIVAEPRSPLVGPTTSIGNQVMTTNPRLHIVARVASHTYPKHGPHCPPSPPLTAEQDHGKERQNDRETERQRDRDRERKTGPSDLRTNPPSR